MLPGDVNAALASDSRHVNDLLTGGVTDVLTGDECEADRPAPSAHKGVTTRAISVTVFQPARLPVPDLPVGARQVSGGQVSTEVRSGQYRGQVRSLKKSSQVSKEVKSG